MKKFYLEVFATIISVQDYQRIGIEPVAHMVVDDRLATIIVCGAIVVDLRIDNFGPDFLTIRL